MRLIVNNKGSATLLTLFLAAVIITVGIAFNWLVKEHMKASEALKIKSESILKARSAYDTLIYLLLSGSLSRREVRVDASEEISPLTRIPVDGQKVSLAPDVSIQVQDSNGKLSLATVDRTAMERLIRTIGGREVSSSILDSYLDWVDEDTLSRLNGAEEFYYRGQGLPPPRNYAIQFKDELQWVKGMDGELYGKLEPYFTILPATGFNPNTAADPVLKAYLNIDEESLKPLKEYLSRGNVGSDVQLFALTGRRISSGAEFGHFYPSMYFEIKVSVGEPKNIYTIQAGLDVRQKARTPYEVLYWIEE
jgi:general secretion pathway protein K